MATTKGSLMILLVEDNQDHAELVIRSCEGHADKRTICHIRDGQAAMDYLFGRGEYAHQSHPRPDVVLLDLRLPKADGLDVLNAIKTSPDLQDIPVVILTSSEVEKDVARAYDYRADSYLVKPVDFEHLWNLLESPGWPGIVVRHPSQEKPSGPDGA